MLSGDHAQTIAICKNRHRDKDFAGIFIAWGCEIIGQAKNLPHSVYYSSHQGCYIPYAITHYEALFDLFSLYKNEYLSLLLEQTNTGTFADVPTEEDHPGISSIFFISMVNDSGDVVVLRSLCESFCNITYGDRVVRAKEENLMVNGGATQKVTAYPSTLFCHSSAAYWYRCTLSPELLGHQDIRAILIRTYVTNSSLSPIKSP